MAWLVPWLLRLREERVAALALAFLVLVTALIAALTPRAVERAGDAALQREVGSQLVSVRNIQLVEERRIAATAADPLANVDLVGERRQAEMPAGIQSLIVGRTFVAESPLWRVISPTPHPSSARIRFQRDVGPRIRFTTGREPASAARVADLSDPRTGQPASFHVFEAALATESAAALDAAVGETVLLSPEPTDVLTLGHDDRIALEIVGTFDVLDRRDPFWFDDPGLGQPALRALASEIEFVTVVGLLAPDAYAPFMRATDRSELPMRYTWRYAVDHSRLDADRMGALIGDLRRLESTFKSIPSRTGAAEGTILRTGLVRIVSAHEARWRSAQTVLTVSAIGPAAVALAALALVALLAMRRRRRMLAIWRARGATLTQLAVGSGLESLMMATPAAVAALAIAVWLVASGATRESVVAAAVVCVAATGIAVLVVSRVGASVTSDPARDAPAVRRLAARRIVFEAVLVIGAIVAAFLLRERGIRGASSVGRLEAADPLVAAVPVLVALAAAVVGIRILPLSLSLLGNVSAWRRDLVPVLALRRATRAGSASPVLVVLLVTATIGAFSSATLVNMDRTSDALAWQSVGAPYRATNPVGPLPLSFDARTLPGAEAEARAFRTNVAVRRAGPVDLLAIDVSGYETVTAHMPGDVQLPDELRVAGAAEPFPAIVSARLAADPDGLRPGDVFVVSVEDHASRFRAIGARETFPTLPIDGRWVVVSRQHLESANEAASLPTTDVFIRAPRDVARSLRDAFSARVPGATFESQAERSAALRGSPVVTVVFAGVAVATLIAGAYAALAVAAALALAGAARATETAQLRTLGLASRDVVALVVAEHAPTIATAFAAGTLLGLGLFLFLRDALGLTAVVGSSLAVPIEVEPIHLLLLLAAVAAIVALGVAIAATLERRAVPATAIRRANE